MSEGLPALKNNKEISFSFTSPMNKASGICLHLLTIFDQMEVFQRVKIQPALVMISKEQPKN